MKFHSPSVNLTLKARRPDKRPYPKQLVNYGDHLRKKRLDLNLSQPQVAKIIQVTTDTITNWELNRVNPLISYISKIILFLEYTPEIEKNSIKDYRINNGLNQKEMAKILQIDPKTLARIERKGNRINDATKTKLILHKLQNRS